MKRKGFTLVELIVSIVLVGIVLASMIGTLLSLKNTYNVINEDMETRTYSALVSKVINEHIMKNNGIKDYDCAGNKCVMTLGTLDKNGHNKKMTLEIVTATLKSNVMKDNKNNSDVGSLMEKTTTIKYYGEDYSYYKTLKYYDRHYAEGNKDIITGYKFENIKGTAYLYDKPDTELKDYLVNITIEMNNPKYNIEVYSTSEVKNADVGNLRLYKLTYNSNGGSTCPDNPKVALDRKPWGELCVPTKPQSGFKGWFIQKDGVFTKEVTAESIALEDIDVYAHWDNNKYSCAAGKYLPAGKTSCETCLENNYCPGITDVYYDKFNNQGMTNCYTGYSSNAGNTKETDCKILCVTNTYMQAKNNSVCTACPSGYISSTHYVEQGKTSECTLKSPEEPVITSSESEVIYGKDDITLTCTDDIDYGGNVTKLYQFGYATSEANYNAGTITWLESASTTNTYKITKTNYVGKRYYVCRTSLQVDPIPKYNCTHNAKVASYVCEANAKVSSYSCKKPADTVSSACTCEDSEGKTYVGGRGLPDISACMTKCDKTGGSFYSYKGSGTYCSSGKSCDTSYCCYTSVSGCGANTQTGVSYTCDGIGGKLCKTNKCCKNETSSCGSWTKTGTNYTCSGIGGEICSTSKCCNNGVVDQLEGWSCNANGEYACPKSGSYSGTYSSGKCTYPAASDYGKTYVSQNNSLVIIKNVKIAFNRNGGNISGTNPLYTRSGVNVFYDGELSSTTTSAPTTSRTGYTWNGWFTEATGGSKILSNTNAIQSKTVDGYIKSSKWTTTVDRTLYAQYSAKTYTLTYNCNGGTKPSGKLRNATATYDEEFNISTDVCTKAGYIQNGWNTASNGSGTNWTIANTNDAHWKWNIDDNVTLYAVWKEKPLQIYYHVNGGTINSSTYSTNNSWITRNGSYFYQTVRSGNSDNPYNYSSFGLTKTGYTATKWCKTASGDTCFNQDTDYTYSQYKGAQKSEKDTYLEVDLYAKWEVLCVVGDYNTVTKKCEYPAIVTQYYCWGNGTANVIYNCICELMDGSLAPFSGGKVDWKTEVLCRGMCESYGWTYVSFGSYVDSYTCPNGNNQATQVCYGVAQYGECPSGYNNGPFPQYYACNNSSHDLSGDICSYSP